MYSTTTEPRTTRGRDERQHALPQPEDNQWEGAWRVLVHPRRAKIQPGSSLNGIGSHQDMLPTYWQQRAIRK